MLISVLQDKTVMLLSLKHTNVLPCMEIWHYFPCELPHLLSFLYFSISTFPARTYYLLFSPPAAHLFSQSPAAALPAGGLFHLSFNPFSLHYYSVVCTHCHLCPCLPTFNNISINFILFILTAHRCKLCIRCGQCRLYMCVSVWVHLWEAAGTNPPLYVTHTLE